MADEEINVQSAHDDIYNGLLAGLMAVNEQQYDGNVRHNVEGAAQNYTTAL